MSDRKRDHESFQVKWLPVYRLRKRQDQRLMPGFDADKTKTALGPHSWARVIVLTIGGAIGCSLVALYLDSFDFALLDEVQRRRAILFDIFVPLLIAAPLLFYFLRKLRELAITHSALTVLAATDSLTGLLNRGAFTASVERHLDRVREQDRDGRGALLVIDADHFKQINDKFGHEYGDDALKRLTASIRGAVRNGDIVGRVGGEEFSVFLPGASPIHAEYIAERIRAAVRAIWFAPSTPDAVALAPWPLSVSVGCAVFNGTVGFKDLFQIADQRLYQAKDEGRDRVAVAILGTGQRLAA